MSELQKQYLFYHKYHKNIVNKVLHMFGIPLIVWSSFLITHRFRIMETRLSMILYTIYLTLYFKIDRLIGTQAGVIYYLIYNHSLQFYKNNKNNSIKYAIYLKYLSWFIQFYGHYFHEGNKPALLDGLVQSFTMAPLFVVYNMNTYFNKLFDKFD